ncbi:MAG TPA: hypothetical protein DCK87_09225 [Desulfotomaculum sp.]|nr:hypothetical protein [Desulfotomaculum sp.]
MEREIKEESPKKFSRREILRATSLAIATVAASKVASRHQETEKETTVLKNNGLPTVGHEVTFVSAPAQKSTPDLRTRVAPGLVSQSVEEKTESSAFIPEERTKELNILGPNAFAPYAGFGGPETPAEEVLDYFPKSYQDAPDGLKGLWGRAVDAKTRGGSQTNIPLPIELETLPSKVYFDYLAVPEGTKFFDIQEQKEKIILCSSEIIVIGRIDKEENFLVLYQDPVNNGYYFAKAGGDVLVGQEDLAARKNLVAEAFNTEFQNLKEVGTPEERERWYEVKEGDSLASIAERFGLPSWHCVYGKNLKILDEGPEKINPGQKIQVPNRFEERELVNGLVVDKNTLSKTEEFFGPKEAEPSQYFPETQHFVKEPYLNLMQELGVEILGYPISEALPENSSQYFQNFIVEWTKVDHYSWIPGRPKLDGTKPHFLMYPLGWTCYFYLTHPGEKFVGYPPPIGQFSLEKVFEKFYKENGGVEIFGYPVSEIITTADGSKSQYLTNCVLNYAPQTGRVSIYPLAEEYYKKMPEEIKKFPWFAPVDLEKNKKIFVDKALEMVGRDEETLVAIEARAIALTIAIKNNDEESLKLPKECAKDKIIFDNLAPGQEISFNNVRAILAWYEARFKMNPALNEALKELSEGGEIINRIIKDKTSSDLFKENKIPKLPSNWEDVFVFLGGSGGLGGGLGADYCPMLYGNYDEYRGDSPDDKQILLEALVQNGLHEAIHSFIQSESLLPHSPWWSKEKPQDPNFVPTDARKGLLAHMSMCVLTSAAQKHYGFEEKRDPRIDYILKVLKEGGVADPEAEVIRAAATFNGDSLWGLYEKMRGADNPSMDSLMSTQNPDLTIIQN